MPVVLGAMRHKQLLHGQVSAIATNGISHVAAPATCLKAPPCHARNVAISRNVCFEEWRFLVQANAGPSLYHSPPLLSQCPSLLILPSNDSIHLPPNAPVLLRPFHALLPTCFRPPPPPFPHSHSNPRPQKRPHQHNTQTFPDPQIGDLGFLQSA